MDKIHAMQLFIRVAELESFSRAADTLGLPKGSVSRQIQALESHVGARLLHRTTRRVQLTQDGMVYYERAKDLLSNLEELDGIFQHDPSSISGRLRVDMPVGVAKKLIIPRLPAFLQQYPGIGLELSSSDRLVDVIREGFDCVVRVGTLKDSGLIARPLGKLTQINCASPQYLARFGYPHSLDDLGDHALIHYASTLGVRPAGFEVVATAPCAG
nr:LysR family transcriptional regulator [Raoultella sp. NCTC 9187]